MAPGEGFEPPTNRLTADRSTTELPRNEADPGTSPEPRILRARRAACQTRCNLDATPQYPPTKATNAENDPVNPNSEATDTELMEKVRDGEIGRLGELFERHHRVLYRFFLRLTASPAVAEDLVQDVFVRLLKYRHTFRGGDFLPWMFRLARNAASDHFGRVHATDPLPEDGAEPAAAAPLASERVVKEQEEARLRVALQSLPAEKRELLLLARFELLPYQEIARLLDTSVGAVKVRVHRALKDLRAAYLRAEEAPV